MAQFFQDKLGYHDNPFQKMGFADVDNAAIYNGAGVQNFIDFILPAPTAGAPLKQG